MKLRLPIGVSDFQELRTDPDTYTFVDKSLFIRDLIDDGAKIILLTRPRRFGKTLNMSMLKYFFSCTKENTAALFDGLKIRDAGDKYWAHQGQYPVIFITLKSAKSTGFERAYRKIQGLVAACYGEFRYLLTVDGLLYEDERTLFQRIIDKEAPQDEVEQSLLRLSEWLYRYHKKRPIILIDEYDAPIHAAYFSDDSDYYKNIIDFMREFFGSTLKDNEYLHKGVLTGILRVARESLFSDLNHLPVYSLLIEQYAEHFGFTEDQVCALFAKSDLAVDLADVKRWYNGYYVGDIVLYNPWSILFCLANKGRLEAYWVNTSEDKLIREMLTRHDVDLHESITELIQGKEITAFINPFLNFNQLDSNSDAVLSLLYMAGYLNALNPKYDEVTDEVNYTFRIPNKEVRSVYKHIIFGWLAGKRKTKWLIACLDDLKAGRMKPFETALQEIAYNILSCHDAGGANPEQFYHGLLLGLVLYLHGDYTILSNREAGMGHYDIALFPKEATSHASGIIFELKRTDNNDEEQLTQVAQEALQQIEDKEYYRMPEAEHAKGWLKLGVAFSGKALRMAYAVAAP